ncbi:MAG: GH25 family lysozyme [Limisphaerales bacterium]
MSAIGAFAQRPLGTDVSNYQPTISWSDVRSAGIVFAWTKATESTTYTSPSFVSQATGARSVGIYLGAYHFARPSVHPNLTGADSADSEANYFWSVAGNYIKGTNTYLVPMLDWEDPNATVARRFHHCLHVAMGQPVVHDRFQPGQGERFDNQTHRLYWYVDFHTEQHISGPEHHRDQLAVMDRFL